MELGGWWVIALPVLVIMIVLGSLSTLRDRRNGTGSYKDYGPNPTKAHIAYVDRAKRLYDRGVTAVRSAADAEARELWEEAEGMGNLSALTGLGILDYVEGNKQLAKARWRRASDGGDIAARIFLLIKETKPKGMTVKAFAIEFLSAADKGHKPRDVDAMYGVVGVAVHFGFKDYANEWSKVIQSEAEHGNRSMDYGRASG